MTDVTEVTEVSGGHPELGNLVLGYSRGFPTSLSNIGRLNVHGAFQAISLGIVVLGLNSPKETLI